MSGTACVVGLGMTGMSLVRHYRQLGWQVRVADERPQPPGLPALAHEFADLTCTHVPSYASLRKMAAGCDEVAVSPGIAPRSLPVELPLTGDIDLFRTAWKQRWQDQRDRPRLIAITGTNGKSTVTNLVARMLTAGGASAAAVGNIGVPLLDALAEWERAGWPQWVVAELSSYQLATLCQPLAADVAVLLNVTADHLAWHGSMTEYLAAKRKVFSAAACGIHDLADAATGQAAREARKCVAFNSSGAGQAGGWGQVAGQLSDARGRSGPTARKLIKVGIMPAAACAALTVAQLAEPGQNPADHLGYLSRAEGLEHRMQPVATVAGVSYINDSKATNVAASCMALEVVGDVCTPIFGGEDKDQDFAPLARMAVARQVPAAILLGGAITPLQQALDAAGISWQPAGTMQAAVTAARELSETFPVRVVLLSPACASFDRYANFAERGADFVREVRRLA